MGEGSQNLYQEALGRGMRTAWGGGVGIEKG